MRKEEFIKKLKEDVKYGGLNIPRVAMISIVFMERLYVDDNDKGICEYNVQPALEEVQKHVPQAYRVNLNKLDISIFCRLEDAICEINMGMAFGIPSLGIIELPLSASKK